MPYPNEHAARIKEPGEFEQDSFRRKEIDSGITIIIGKLKGESTTTTQAYRFDKSKFSADQAKQWLKDHDINPISFEAASESNNEKEYTLDDVEIFAAGTWNGDTYTTKDLDDMVRAQEEIGDKIKPYIKLGHSKNQSLLQQDGYPAAGWITNLRRKGEKLVASISGVPEKIYTLIEKKGYGRFSSEIFWNLKIDKKNYSKVLKAVALLGADTPEVSSLDDFINLYTIDDYKFETIKEYHTLKNYEVGNMDYEKVIQEIMAKLEAMQGQIDELKGGAGKQEEMKGECMPGEEKKKMMSKIEELENKLVIAEYEKKHSEVKAYLDKSLEEGKITPAQMEHYFAICMSDNEIKKYTTQDKKNIEGTGFDFVKKIIECSKEVDFSASTERADMSHTAHSNTKSDIDELDKKCKEYAKKHNVSYGEAYDKIANNVED